MSSNPADEKGDLKNIYKVGLNTTRLVYVLGDLTVAWLLLRGAEVALEKLGGEVSASDKSFYEGKVAAAQFFARNVLPQLAGERAIAENVDGSLMMIAKVLGKILFTIWWFCTGWFWKRLGGEKPSA